ncbi:MAG TPA: PPC domain-containing protein [Pirellulaceae bacterium]|nr:PPC domain-containing protein [Pirellulaceae bacterium]
MSLPRGAGILPAVMFAALALPARAELPFPRFDRLQPLGLAAGGSVEVEINGADIEGLSALRFDQLGLSAEPIAGKERWFKITAAPDVPAGTYDVRLVGRFGVSSSKLLAVQHGLAEVAEPEPNNEPSQAQAVQVNCVINGSSDGENVDLYRFTAKAGQRIVLDVDAQKLDSMLDSQLVVLNAAGKQLASCGDYHGRDSLIDFIVPADGEYIAVLHDLSYRGGYPYRLTISDRPHVENVFPRAVQRGQTAQLTAYGRNLGGGPAAVGPTGEPALESTSFGVMADVPPGQYRFLEHPTDHSVLPTAATFRLEGMQVRPSFPAGESLTAVTLLVVDEPVTLEAEPNDKQDSPQSINLPAVVSGRFDQPRDADWFEFTASENGQYAVEIAAERLAAQADSYFVLFDEQGNRQQEFDDYGHRINAFDGHLRDPVGNVNMQAGKKYRLLVLDRYQRGGPRFQYVLTIRKAVPEAFVGVIHRENPTPAGLNLWRGGSTYLDLVIHHRDGNSTPVTISVKGPPPGVHFLPTTIPSDSRGAFVLWTDDNAPDFLGAIELVATYESGGQKIERPVRSYTRVWNDAKGSSRPTRDLAAAVVEKAPFLVVPDQERVEVKAGDKLELKVQIKRLWPEFTGDLKLLPLSWPGNFQMPELPVAAGASEATVAITVQNGTAPNEYTLALLAQAQVPFHKDPAAKERPNTLVSLASRPITIVVQPAVKP